MQVHPAPICIIEHEEQLQQYSDQKRYTFPFLQIHTPLHSCDMSLLRLIYGSLYAHCHHNCNSKSGRSIAAIVMTKFTAQAAASLQASHYSGSQPKSYHIALSLFASPMPLSPLSPYFKCFDCRNVPFKACFHFPSLLIMILQSARLEPQPLVTCKGRRKSDSAQNRCQDCDIQEWIASQRWCNGRNLSENAALLLDSASAAA